MTLNLQRVSWIGSLVVCVSVLPALFFLFSPNLDAPLAVSISVRPKIDSSPIPINLSLRSDYPELSIGASQDQFSFAMDPVRPDVQSAVPRFLIRLKDSKQMKRVEMPASLGLAFDSSGILQFSDDASSFGLECRLLPDQRIEARLSCRTPTGEVVTQAQWVPVPMETPLQTIDEFCQQNPFRELAESRWWGPDLLIQKVHGGEAIHRIEVGAAASSKLIDCQVGDWLHFTGKNWEKCASPVVAERDSLQNFPLAHIKSATSQFLEVEGWKDMSHLRFQLNLASSPPFKIKADELFSQLRVRSEKQVSCTMDKQCLVLRPGDWVLKSGGRWKTLRKMEEKAALLAGEVSGEVFVLEKIGVASSAKNIVGYYFSAGRTQSVLIEMAQRVQKGRKASR